MNKVTCDSGKSVLRCCVSFSSMENCAASRNAAASSELLKGVLGD